MQDNEVDWALPVGTSIAPCVGPLRGTNLATVSRKE
jgi:hypothetical protein